MHRGNISPPARPILELTQAGLHVPDVRSLAVLGQPGSVEFLPRQLFFCLLQTTRGLLLPIRREDRHAGLLLKTSLLKKQRLLTVPGRRRFRNTSTLAFRLRGSTPRRHPRHTSTFRLRSLSSSPKTAASRSLSSSTCSPMNAAPWSLTPSPTSAAPAPGSSRGRTTTSPLPTTPSPTRAVDSAKTRHYSV